MNVGSCEQEQLEVMDVPNMHTLAEIIQKMYADLIQSGKDTKYTYTHALEPDDDGFANLITFDCRQYLKPGYLNQIISS